MTIAQNWGEEIYKRLSNCSDRLIESKEIYEELKPCKVKGGRHHYKFSDNSCLTLIESEYSEAISDIRTVIQF